MTDFNFDSKSAVIFGLPDSGKSTLAHFIASKFGSACFIYDTLSEYPDEPFYNYRPQDRYSVPECERVIRWAMNTRKFRLIMIDEANRFCPSKPAPLPQAIADLNDWRAHYNLSTLYIARLPVQLNQDLTELAQYAMVFNLPGGLATDYLNTRLDGLGDAVKELPAYHFILVDHWRSYEVMAPVPKDFKTDKQHL